MKLWFICVISCVALAAAKADDDKCDFFKRRLRAKGEWAKLYVGYNFDKDCNKVADDFFEENEVELKAECVKLCTDEEYKEQLKRYLHWFAIESRHYGGWPPKAHTPPKGNRFHKPTHKKPTKQ